MYCLRKMLGVKASFFRSAGLHVLRLARRLQRNKPLSPKTAQHLTRSNLKIPGNITFFSSGDQSINGATCSGFLSLHSACPACCRQSYDHSCIYRSDCGIARTEYHSVILVPFIYLPSSMSAWHFFFSSHIPELRRIVQMQLRFARGMTKMTEKQLLSFTPRKACPVTKNRT